MEFVNEFVVDEVAEKEGKWIKYKDASFLIARSGSRKYLNELEKMSESYSEILDIQDEDLTEELEEKQLEVQIDISVKMGAKHVLLGWKGVKYEGKELKYSVENAEKLLKHRPFRNWVFDQSNDYNNYKVEQYKEAEKN